MRITPKLGAKNSTFTQAHKYSIFTQVRAYFEKFIIDVVNTFIIGQNFYLLQMTVKKNLILIIINSMERTIYNL